MGTWRNEFRKPKRGGLKHERKRWREDALPTWLLLFSHWVVSAVCDPVDCSMSRLPCPSLCPRESLLKLMPINIGAFLPSHLGLCHPLLLLSYLWTVFSLIAPSGFWVGTHPSQPPPPTETGDGCAEVFLTWCLSFRDGPESLKVISWAVKLVRSWMKIYIHFKKRRIYNY